MPLSSLQPIVIVILVSVQTSVYYLLNPSLLSLLFRFVSFATRPLLRHQRTSVHECSHITAVSQIGIGTSLQQHGNRLERAVTAAIHQRRGMLYKSRFRKRRGKNNSEYY